MTEKNPSAERQQAIENLLNKMLISDQKTLVGLLKQEFGIETNQSVLSRDLRKLGVIKKEVDQQMFYSLPNTNVIDDMLKLAIVDVKYNETMIVIKTHPGLAAFVGDYIDQQEGLDILGCLAGENVVFIACCSVKNIQETFEKICKVLNFKIKIT